MSRKLLTTALTSLSAASGSGVGLTSAAVGASLASGTVPASVSTAFAHLSSVAGGNSFTLPDLPYGYGDLEPSIVPEIMTLHHSKHHQTYVTNLNAAMEKYADAEAKGDLGAMIALQGAIKFNGGGHVNHSIFWTNLAPTSKGGGEEPTGELASYIDAAFGDFKSFKAKMIADTAAVQGSGWGWLGYDKAKDAVRVVTTANQDPCSTTGLVPLLGIDVWEHAYYLQYKNVRPDYLNAIFEVIDFANVAGRLEAAKK